MKILMLPKKTKSEDYKKGEIVRISNHLKIKKIANMFAIINQESYQRQSKKKSIK